MIRKAVDIALIKHAQRGQKESLSALTELVRKDVLAYLFRLTLDEHLSEDLCHETLIQMLESLPKLKLTNEKSFWSWIYKTAFSKVSRQFRNQGKTRIKNRTINDSQLLKHIPDYRNNGPQYMMHKELTVAVYEAMDSIKLKYRNILTLRCFQDLSYSQIALTTGGTELQARLLFFRAKRSLRHQLASRGFKKKGQLLPALSLFAALTAGQYKSVSAATIVKAASLNVSTGVAALGIATTKVGIVSMIAVATCITVGVANLDVSQKDVSQPNPVLRRVKNEDLIVFKLLHNPDFQRPFGTGKLIMPDNNGFFWTNRSYKRRAQPNADIDELIVNRTEQNKLAVVIPTDYWIDFKFQNPIIDGPSVDIIIAGWTSPNPQVEVFNNQGQIQTLKNPKQLMDTWGRIILGYDLSDLPGQVIVDTLRITGVHNQGPHGGFELNEIRARIR